MGSLEGNDVDHFRFFAKQVEAVVSKYGSLSDEELLEIQRAQVDGLAKLEIEFRDTLFSSGLAEVAFNIFYDYIKAEKKNLLAARPYFRERSAIFSKGLMTSLKKRDYKTTGKYHINYLFIREVMKNLPISRGVGHPLEKIYQKIVDLRYELVLMNMPLVISRARIFYSKTPRSHLSFMDLVQIGMSGMISGIDKYCGKYRREWRGVCVLRIRGDYIRHYSHTLLHFYPKDKKRLYNANKFRARHVEGEYTEEEFIKALNEDPGSKVTAEEVRQIMLASSLVSCDTRPPIDDENIADDNITRIAAPEEDRPDYTIEKQESLAAMRQAISTLSLIDRKLLYLKGVDVDF